MMSSRDFVELMDRRLMTHCGSCKHWNTSAEGGSVHLPAEGYGICEKIRDLVKDVPAYVAFGYDLATTANFGCVLWEPKDGIERLRGGDGGSPIDGGDG